MRPTLTLLSLLALAFTLGVVCCEHAAPVLRGPAAAARDDGAAGVGGFGFVLGETRRLLAQHLYRKADVYFHSGYYPTMFDDQSSFHTPHMALYSDVVDQEKNARDAAKQKPVLNVVVPDEEGGSPGVGEDWIARVNQQIHIVRHTHLDQRGDPGKLRELLPWLRLSVELDPHRAERYVIASYWLRSQVGRPAEAEKFLREGLEKNPGSPEILFELGRVFAEHHDDPQRALNLWQAAFRSWQRLELSKAEPNYFLCQQITAHLANGEEAAGNLTRAMLWWGRAASVADDTNVLRERLTKAARLLAEREPVQFATVP